MESTWYYGHNNEQRGPVTGPELVALEGAGLVRPDTLVWKAGLEGWQPWASVAADVRSAAGMAAPLVAAVAAAPGVQSTGEVAVCAYSGQTRPTSLMVKYGDRWVALEYKDAFLQSLREGASVARMAGVGEFQYIGFWWRVLSLIIDFLVLLIPGILVTLPYYYLFFKKAFAGGVTPSMDPLNEFKTMGGAMLVAYVVAMVGNFLLPLVYETIMYGKFGATVGKLAIGARVVKPGGEPLTYRQALGRSGAKLLNILIWVIPANIAMVVGSIMSFGTGLQSGMPKDIPVAMLVGMLVSFLWYLFGPFGFYMAGWTLKKQTLHDKMAKTVVVKKNPV